MDGGARKFKNPDKNYSSFKTTKRPHSPSPKRADYEKVALRKSDKHSKCTFIHPETNKRCKRYLGMYPKYCSVHTLLIDNLYISKSNIKNAGNGLFSGYFGFKKGDIVSEYSMPWMEVKAKRLETRNEDHDASYVFCDEQKRGQKYGDVMCWDGIDIRSTIARNANDAHGSKYKNNTYFDTKTSNGKKHVYIIASRNIAPKTEIFTDYGENYWN